MRGCAKPEKGIPYLLNCALGGMFYPPQIFEYNPEIGGFPGSLALVPGAGFRLV
jgi:hypothetical protein